MNSFNSLSRTARYLELFYGSIRVWSLCCMISCYIAFTVLCIMIHVIMLLRYYYDTIVYFAMG